MFDRIAITLEGDNVKAYLCTEPTADGKVNIFNPFAGHVLNNATVDAVVKRGDNLTADGEPVRRVIGVSPDGAALLYEIPTSPGATQGIAYRMTTGKKFFNAQQFAPVKEVSVKIGTQTIKLDNSAVTALKAFLSGIAQA